MVLAIVRMLRKLADALLEEDAPRWLALGFALGMMIGLVPAHNLTSYVLWTVLLASRSNLVAGAAGALVFSWIGMLADPVSHRIGMALLTLPSLQSTWTSLFGLPLVPWTNLNNSVVLGSLLLGVVLFYPAYRLSWLVFGRYREKILARMEAARAVQALKAAETTVKWRAA